MSNHIFDGIDGGVRSSKPRLAGLTMVADWGMGPRAQDDLVEYGASFFDFAKVAVGISRLLSDTQLREKIQCYRKFGVEAFPGGQFLEYAEIEGVFDRYLPAVVEAGYRWVEVSDNLAPVGLDWKENAIRLAVDKFGLEVLGEVGKKEGLENDAPLAENAKACLAGGAKIILVEAAELMREDVETAAEVEAVIEAVGIEKVMFELPGPWIEGISQHHIHQMRARLIGRFGAEVNLGNVAATDLIPLEAYRRGIGVNAGAPLPDQNFST